MIDNAHEVPCTAIAGNDNKETRSKRDTIYDKESDDEKDSFEVITIMTYGKRFGSIDKSKCEKVWNCRGVANPACSRKGKTGLIKKFREDVVRDPFAQSIIEEALQNIIGFYALDYTDSCVLVSSSWAFFCEHGKHRSVAIAETVAERLQHYRVPITIPCLKNTGLL